MWDDFWGDHFDAEILAVIIGMEGEIAENEREWYRLMKDREESFSQLEDGSDTWTEDKRKS